MTSIDTTRAPQGRSGLLRRGPYDLSYRIEGEGPPVLVIGSAVYYPRVLSQALRRRVTLAFVDHRGFGRRVGEPGPQDIGLDAVVADIEALRSHLGLERPVVLGHSGHAYMALAYAEAHPDRVRGLVLVAAGPSHAPEVMAFAERRWQELVAPARKARFAADMAGLEAAIAADPQRRFVAFCLATRARMWADPGFDAAPLWEGVVTDMAVIDALWGEAFSRIDVAEGLDRLAAPVLLALGRLDYAVAPPETWDALRPAFRDLRVRVFEGSGHTPMLEEPAAFDDALLDWLAGVPR